MIVRPNAPPLTVQHYRNLPETGPRYQLIDGDLHMSPAPNRFHQDISRNLEFILLQYLAEHQIGILYDAPFDVYLTETDVFQPDIVIIMADNYRILTEAGAEGAPDLVVEILSPKTRRLDLENKLRTYSRLGVKELWIIDPGPQKLARYVFDRDPEQPVEVFEQNGRLATELLPEFSFEIADIFRR